MSVWFWDKENALSLFIFLEGTGWYFYDYVADTWFPGRPGNDEVYIGEFD